MNPLASMQEFDPMHSVLINEIARNLVQSGFECNRFTHFSRNLPLERQKVSSVLQQTFMNSLSGRAVRGPSPGPGASRLDVGDPFEAILELDDEAIAHRTIGIHDLLA